MIGLGTLINVGGILLGGLLGALFGKAINVRIQETIMKATGLCVIFLGIGGAIEKNDDGHRIRTHQRRHHDDYWFFCHWFPHRGNIEH